MIVRLGSLRCSGKKGIYPSEIELEEKRVLEDRLNILNETLIEHMKTTTTTTATTTTTTPSIPSLPSGYKTVKSDFGTVVYKLYEGYKTRPEALKKCTSDGSFLHFPQPSNEQENLFYFDLIYPSAKHDVNIQNENGAMWLDISRSNNFTNWAEKAASSSGNPYITMIFLNRGVRNKNWNRVAKFHKYMFVCTAVF